MTAPVTHSRFYSPSKSKIFIQCAASILFNDGSNDEVGQAAIYGTQCHELGASLICKSLQLTDYEEEPKSIEDVIKGLNLYDDDMQSIANGYADYVVNLYEFEKRRIGADPFVVVEQHLDMDFDETARGTLDFGLIAGDTLTVVDLKTGRTPVQAYDQEMNLFNTQLGIYALYFYKTYKDIYPNVKKIRLIIYQPVINNTNEYEFSLGELLDFEKDVLIPAVEKTRVTNPEATPGNYCKYCGGRAICKKRLELLNQIYLDRKPETLTDVELENLLPKLDQIVNYAQELQAFCLKRAENGHKFKGYKLVHSKVSRVIADQQAVIEICQKEGVDPYANKKLAGVTELAKRLGKDKFKELIGPFLEIQQGSIVLVPESDIREEIKNTEELNNA